MQEKLRKILELSSVPEGIIREIEEEPVEYQKTLLDALQAIMQNEVINLLAFMETRETIRKKFKLAGSK